MGDRELLSGSMRLDDLALATTKNAILIDIPVWFGSTRGFIQDWVNGEVQWERIDLPLRSIRAART